MRFEHTNSYPASPEQVLAMLLDPGFREAVCARQQALEHTVQVSGSGPGSTVVVSQRQSMAGAPAIAVKLTGDAVDIVQTERWHTGTEADFSMEIPGKPGHLRGSAVLRSSGNGSTDEVFSGQVTVKVPLIGGKLEEMIASVLAKALRTEGLVGRQWLSDGAR